MLKLINKLFNATSNTSDTSTPSIAAVTPDPQHIEFQVDAHLFEAASRELSAYKNTGRTDYFPELYAETIEKYKKKFGLLIENVDYGLRDAEIYLDENNCDISEAKHRMEQFLQSMRIETKILYDYFKKDRNNPIFIKFLAPFNMNSNAKVTYSFTKERLIKSISEKQKEENPNKEHSALDTEYPMEAIYSIIYHQAAIGTLLNLLCLMESEFSSITHDLCAKHPDLKKLRDDYILNDYIDTSLDGLRPFSMGNILFNFDPTHLRRPFIILNECDFRIPLKYRMSLRKLSKKPYYVAPEEKERQLAEERKEFHQKIASRTNAINSSLPDSLDVEIYTLALNAGNTVFIQKNKGNTISRVQGALP